MATIANDGLEYQARYTNQESTGTWTAMAVGSGSSTESSASTALGVELSSGGFARAAATRTYEASYKSVWSKTWTSSTDVTVRECAVLNSTTVAGSKMLMRHVFAANKSLVDTDTLAITFKLTQSV
jgi:hypothetical protein